MLLSFYIVGACSDYSYLLLVLIQSKICTIRSNGRERSYEYEYYSRLVGSLLVRVPYSTVAGELVRVRYRTRSARAYDVGDEHLVGW